MPSNNLRNDLADSLERAMKETTDQVLKELNPDAPPQSKKEQEKAARFIRLQAENEAKALDYIINKYVIARIQQLENRISGML